MVVVSWLAAPNAVITNDVKAAHFNFVQMLFMVSTCHANHGIAVGEVSARHGARL